MRIFKDGLKFELYTSLVVILSILLTITLSVALLRTLNFVQSGSLLVSKLPIYMFGMLISWLSTILSLALFLATVSTFGRMMQDHEVLIWLTSGLKNIQLVTFIFRLILPIIFVVTALVMYIAPYTRQNSMKLVDNENKGSQLENYPAKELRKLGFPNTVFFLEKNLASEQAVEGLFFYNSNKNRDLLLIAKTGKVDQGKLKLSHGQQLMVSRKDNQVQVINFKENAITIPLSEHITTQDHRAQSLNELWGDESNKARGELSWRFGMIVATINLIVWSTLSLTIIKPRKQVRYNLFLAVLMFFTYFNFINVGQQLITSGRYSFVLVFSGLHLLALSILLAQVYFNTHQFGNYVRNYSKNGLSK
ncbi:MAG: LptF/LptG family permease [Gammaproteobacteria bacterium]|nr:LptF/LptG family permease [Gammaproteobacteria bacterium]